VPCWGRSAHALPTVGKTTKAIATNEVAIEGIAPLGLVSMFRFPVPFG
jgi:hypothetical protein